MGDTRLSQERGLPRENGGTDGAGRLVTWMGQSLDRGVDAEWGQPAEGSRDPEGCKGGAKDKQLSVNVSASSDHPGRVQQQRQRGVGQQQRVPAMLPASRSSASLQRSLGGTA